MNPLRRLAALCAVLALLTSAMPAAAQGVLLRGLGRTERKE